MHSSIHLSELKKGSKSWNLWRREHSRLIPNLSGVDLTGFDLSLVDLRGANLKSATLKNARLFAARLAHADLRGANLSNADLQFAELTNCRLDHATLDGANLQEANLRKAILIETKLFRANLNLATLNLANLFQANLSKADLSSATLRSANLQGADLSAAQVLGANFTDSIFTAACLMDWNTNDKTFLERVQCDYVYLKKTGKTFINRFPEDRLFQPGEFTAQFQKSSNSPEFFLPDGISELSQSLKSLKYLYPDIAFAIREVEPSTRNAVLVRLEASSLSDQKSIEEFHQEQVQLAEAAYKLQMTEIARMRQWFVAGQATSQSLTPTQKQRLETQKNTLQKEWDIRSRKLKDLRQALAVEAGTANRFQLKEQVQNEEEELKKLGNKLDEIEQLL